jgi:hypothetical protein
MGGGVRKEGEALSHDLRAYEFTDGSRTHDGTKEVHVPISGDSTPDDFQ